MNLSRRDRELAEWIGRQGFKRPFLIVGALRKADIKPQTALALLEKESGDASNIYGHDAVETNGIYAKGGPVTESNYAKYREWRGSGAEADRRGRMQGVGPTQLTYWSLQERADRAGGAWKPYVNMVTGMTIFREYVRESGSIWEAAKRYNGAAPYADDFLVKREKWQGKLIRAGFRVA